MTFLTTIHRVKITYLWKPISANVIKKTINAVSHFNEKILHNNELVSQNNDTVSLYKSLF